jgi:hypothetical protein
VSASGGGRGVGGGTFYLSPGVSTITGNFLGEINFGDVDCIVEPIPEPPTLLLVGVGLVGLARRRGHRTKSRL